MSQIFGRTCATLGGLAVGGLARGPKDGLRGGAVVKWTRISGLVVLAACLGFSLATSPPASAQQEVSFTVNECTFSWTARYQRNGNTVVVRIKLVPEAGVTTSLAALQTRWQSGIQTKWSNKFACSPGTPNLTFNVQFVNTNEHHAVTVKAGSGRSNMLEWYEQDNGNTAAHEYGHMLGMKDEYPDPNCPNRSPVNTGTVMAVLTGPIVQRYIDAVCRSVPGAPKKEKPDCSAGAKEKKVEKITPDDLAQPARFTLVVSGGPPGKRLEYMVVANEESRAVTYKYLDELNKVGQTQGNGELSPRTVTQLKAVVRKGALPAEEVVGGPFVPGMVVGTLTIEVADKKQVLRYPVEESKSEKWGHPSTKAMDAIKPAKNATAIREVHQLLTEEAKRVAGQGKQ